jgi:hypothetical protein
MPPALEVTRETYQSGGKEKRSGINPLLHKEKSMKLTPARSEFFPFAGS